MGPNGDRSRSPRSHGAAVESFIEDNKLDEKSAGALRELGAEQQKAVIERYVTGGNPSAIVMSRIRSIAAGGPASPLAGGQVPQGICGGGAGTWRCPGCSSHVLLTKEQCLMCGTTKPPRPPPLNPNHPSLLAFASQAAIGASQQHQAALPGWPTPPLGAPVLPPLAAGSPLSPMALQARQALPRLGVPREQRMESGTDLPPGLDLVSQFIAQYDLDASVENALRALPWPAQQSVMDKYVTGRNKSAVVMCRIREASAAVQMEEQLANPALAVERDAIAQFCAENDLDQGVEQALRAAPAHVQQQATQCYVTGSNKSAVMMRRLRDLLDANPDTLRQEYLLNQSPDPIAAFMMENALDQGVERALRDLTPEQFATVADKYVTGTNKSAVVMRRIRDLQDGVQPCNVANQQDSRQQVLGQHMLSQHLLGQQVFGQQMLRQQVLSQQVLGQQVLGHGLISPASVQLQASAAQGDAIAQFCVGNELDAGVDQALRQQPPEIQMQVMDKYVTGSNKSAVVMKRIRDLAGPPQLPVQTSVQSFLSPALLSGQTGVGRAQQFFTQPLPQTMDEVALWCQHEGLDAGVVAALRQQPLHIQCAVMEKTVSGNNKSAVVMKRIRDLQQPDGVSARSAVMGDPHDPVHQFIIANDLDDGCTRALKDQPPEVVQEVISKYVTGSNKSAVVMRRIRDLRFQAGLEVPRNV